MARKFRKRDILVSMRYDGIKLGKQKFAASPSGSQALHSSFSANALAYSREET